VLAWTAPDDQAPVHALGPHVPSRGIGPVGPVITDDAKEQSCSWSKV
jgi:hypothetical protein